MDVRCLVLLLLHTITVYSGTFNFTSQPKDANLNEGDQMRLDCSVSPIFGDLTYRWFMSDAVVGNQIIDSDLTSLDGQRASFLYYSEISRDQQGYYHCVVESGDYKIYSRVAHVTVNYFTEPSATIEVTEKFTENSARETLTCSVPDSSPESTVTWFKDGLEVSDPRYVVIPETTNLYIHGERGSLIILNVKDTDGGVYECVTEAINGNDYVLNRYTIDIKSGSNEVLSRPSFLFPIGSTDITTAPGDSVTLECAGSGNPVPAVKWYKIESDGSESDISKTDTNQLENYNRRLVVGNIKEASTYKCTIQNTINGQKITDSAQFFIQLATVEDTNIEIVQGPSPIHVLKPNLYTPFTLECYIKNAQQNMIMWLKDGDSLESNRRSHIEEGIKEIGGVEVFYRNIISETPNEQDLGVYQCIVYNTAKLETVTSYVVLEEDSATYRTSDKEPIYSVIKEPLKVDEAEEVCVSQFNGHLVSVMDEQENYKIMSLLRYHNMESSWIGLTRENPDPIGFWIWTQPGDISTSYSNWELGKPDNKQGRQEYAVMLNTTGQWTDVSKEDTRPSVCKEYLRTCSSIDEYFEGDVRVRGWESSGAQYQVGEQVEVYCRWPSNEVQPRSVTCGIDGSFSPAIKCPNVESSSIPRSLNHLVILLSVLLITR